MIRRISHTAIVIVVLTALLLGSSGINIRIHDCSGSRKKEYLAYPEYQQSTKGSCCAAGHLKNTPPARGPVNLHKSNCCKLSTITLKVNPYEHQYTTQASVLISPEFPSLVLSEEMLPADDSSSIACNSPPPQPAQPLSGKERVYLFRQIRIPVSC